MYRVDPYELILPKNPEMKSISNDPANWNEVRVVQGETLVELGFADKFDHEDTGAAGPDGIDESQWFVVTKDNPDLFKHSQRALVSKN